MSTCKKLLSELSSYLDNELDLELRAEIETHMQLCPNCYIVIDSTRKTVQIFKDCAPYDVPPTLHMRIEQALRLHSEKANKES